jgi:aryl-alcohol dehydrogenase-like predicted oxidoreductase
MIVRGDAVYVKQACPASSERLGVYCFDLYYQHRVDPNTHIEETVTTMAELKNEGNIKYPGLSEFSAMTLRRIHAAKSHSGCAYGVFLPSRSRSNQTRPIS